MRPLARLGAGVAGGAVLIAAVTAASRVVGFGRWLVFGEAVGASCLGTAYSTANMLPNIVFEVVAGGALAGVVVPLIAGPLARGDPQAARQTASALLTWVVVGLVPISVLGALAAGPVMAGLVQDPAGCVRSDVIAVATRMFMLFAPQIALYGVAVVCSGVLNAQRRFLAAALAPLLSALVVIATYAAVAARWAGDRDDLAALPRRWELALALGTTGGVLVLAATTAGPVLGLGWGLRPTLRFPPGAAPAARRLAGAGLAGLLAQQLAVLVVLVLTGDVGGAINVYNYAWAVYLLPYAVLAVPVATSAFPLLSEQAGRGDRAGFAATVAASSRGVLLVGALGAGVLAGTAFPVARTFIGPGEQATPGQLAWSLVAFAPGLVGYGLVALLGRALYALHAGRPAGTATVVGWVVAAGGSWAGVAATGGRWTVPAIAVATSMGMLLAAGLLLAAVRRHAGPAALHGLPRAAAAGGAAAAAAAGVCAAAASVAEPAGKVANAALATGAGAAGTLAAVAVVLALDGSDLRALIRRRRPARG